MYMSADLFKSNTTQIIINLIINIVVSLIVVIITVVIDKVHVVVLRNKRLVV